MKNMNDQVKIDARPLVDIIKVDLKNTYGLGEQIDVC